MHRNAAIAAQLGLLAYFELCVLLPLGAWNDQPGNAAFSLGNLVLAGTIGCAQLLLFIGTAWRIRPLLWLGLIGDLFWLASHIKGIWIPYLFGASPRYAEMYRRVFGRTTKLLPNFSNHLAPDAMHIVLDLLLATAILTLILYMRQLPARNASAQTAAIAQ